MHFLSYVRFTYPKSIAAAPSIEKGKSNALSIVKFQMIMMKLNNQNLPCHAERVSRSPERSEGEASLARNIQMLRCAQHDKLLLFFAVKLHHEQLQLFVTIL